MAKIFVVTSGKGGVGKTTLTVNIGAALAGMGHKVLLIDGDTGLRNLDLAMGQQNEVVYDYLDVIEGTCRAEDAILQYRGQPRLYMLPAAQLGDRAGQLIPRDMIYLCETLRPMFAYILIDCPAGIGRGFKNAISGADSALIVTTPNLAAIRDADRVLGLLEETGIEEQLLIINRIRMDMIKKKMMMSVDEIINILGVNTIGLVPEDEYVLESGSRGDIAVLTHDGLGREAFLNIARRLCGEVVPIANLEGRNGFWNSIKRFFGSDD